MPADTSLPEGVTLVDAFPFDSNPQLITDVNGYLRGDRSVDAWTMQNTFRQFFSDGVFGTPADALQIKKGTSGLTVTIEPGMFVIQGGMGGVKESDGPLTLTLDTGAAAGNLCYGIMLRYDNNADMRGLGFRVVKGTAGASPQPPEPDQTSENVMEYRLGYVTVPNGATDLSAATVHNEKGTSVCPYAAPFDEIDLSSITADALSSANEALTSLLAYFEQYRDAIDAALSDEEATHLQQQITALQEQLSNFDLGGSVDNETVEYATKLPGDSSTKLRVKASGIQTEHVADGAITNDKLADDVETVPSGAANREMLTHIGGTTGWTKLSGLLDLSPVALWSGTWANGSITVDNIKDYSVYIVTVKYNNNIGKQPACDVLVLRSGSGMYGCALGKADGGIPLMIVVNFTANDSGVLTGSTTHSSSSIATIVPAKAISVNSGTNVPFALAITSIKGVC